MRYHYPKESSDHHSGEFSGVQLFDDTDTEMESHVNLELDMLLGLSRERHKNIIQVLYTFRSVTPDKKVLLCF